MARHVACCGIALLALGACGSDDPQVPTTFAPAGGVTLQLTGTVATAVTASPQVQILDAKGKGIKGLRVRWRVGANSGGVVNDSTVTDGGGVALSGGWTLGPAAGVQTLTASADGVSAVTFTAQVAAGPATNLVRVSADGQVATVNATVAQAPSARAQDVFGNPVSGIPVTFDIASGGGAITGAQQTTDVNGLATAASWKLGSTAGQQVARASAPNVSQALFLANALAGPPTTLTKAVGDNQDGVSGFAVGVAPGVRVTDDFNNPVGNVPVTFTPGANSGTVTNATVTSNANTGIAAVGSWVLSGASTQTLVATSASIPGKSVTFNATSSNSQFGLEVRFVGNGGTPEVRQAFLNAAVRWRRVIIGHVHTLPVNEPAGDCLSWMPAINETFNDVVIYARIGPIDGVNNILARAGPCYFSLADNLTIMGIMEFDEADLTNMLNNGTFGDVVLHEMGHVLGIGTLWDQGRSLLQLPGTAAPFYNGAGARAAFAAINTVTFSGTPVPVEGNQYGPGTRDSHWRESVFGRELMQGFAKVGGMPMSRVTVASLADMGYVVNLAAADPYSITSPILQGFVQADIAPLVPMHSDLLTPLYGFDRNGKLSRVVPPRPR
jgi:hypothetical protein